MKLHFLTKTAIAASTVSIYYALIQGVITGNWFMAALACIGVLWSVVTWGIVLRNHLSDTAAMAISAAGHIAFVMVLTSTQAMKFFITAY